jgi:hypothetical protein
MQLGRPIGAANANAVARGIVPHAKSSSSTGTCIIDCIQLSFIVFKESGGRWNGTGTPLGRQVGVADADAMAKGIVPCAKSSSSTGTCIIDCIQPSVIVLSSVEADGTASAHHLAGQ